MSTTTTQRSSVTREMRGAIALCTLHGALNGALDDDLIRALDGATAELEHDSRVRAVVLLGGSGGVFADHYPIEALREQATLLRSAGVERAQASEVPERPIDTLLARIEQMRVPVIAALNGSAVGAGLELALACDLRVAERGEARFGLPEVRVGLCPGAGGTQRLPRLIGAARALELILRGRLVSPEEALAFGLVHELAPVGGALSRALEIAEELVARSAAALEAIKQLVRHHDDRSRQEGLAAERQKFVALLTSEAAARQLAHGDALQRRLTR